MENRVGMEITVLVENTTGNSALTCEHGLSLLIHYEGRKILLDAGTTDAFWSNAEAMGISLMDVDTCVLSHGHYDHSGGFARLFAENERARVYAMRTAADTYYSGNGGMHEIGIPREVLSYRERFLPVDGCRQVYPGVYLVPHQSEHLGKIGEKARLYKSVDGDILPDDFAHEQSLVFDTPQGLIIFNSCSHGGVSNIIREVREACGGRKVYAYVGGLHMKGKQDDREICIFADEEIDALCKTIEQEDLHCIYTGHCTGQVGLRKLQERLGDKVQALTTGGRYLVE